MAKTAVEKLGKFIDSEVIADIILDQLASAMPEGWTMNKQGVAIGKDVWLQILETSEFNDLIEMAVDAELDLHLKP